MTNQREGAIIVSLIDALNDRGSFCGETHVQKGAFLLKELTGAPIDSLFTLYLQDLYSFQIHKLLNELRAEELVSIEPRRMGASWRPGERYHLLKRSYRLTIESARRQVDFVADRIARLETADLEPLATALYVSREKPSAAVEARVGSLREIKRSITETAAHTAVETVDTWLSEAREAGFS